MEFTGRFAVLAFTALFLFVPGFGADKKGPKALSPGEISRRATEATVAIQCIAERKGDPKTTPDSSGFLVSSNGEIVTNLRSIAQCQQIAVRLSSGDVYDSVTAIDLDLRRDLLILKIKAASLPALPLGDSNALEVGQTLYSPPLPLQKSQVGGFRQMDGYKLVQLSAANSGVAGGPVMDEQGRVVAIAAAPVAVAENQAFALPVNYAKGYLDGKDEMPLSAVAALVRAADKPKTVPTLIAPAPTGTGGGIGSGKGGGVGTNAPPAGVFTAGNGVTPPRILSKREPEYTEAARKAKLSGSVVLQFVVDEKGHAVNIRVTKSLGLGLDEKAIDAVTQWVWEPGKKDGKAVPVMATIEVAFRLL